MLSPNKPYMASY